MHCRVEEFQNLRKSPGHTHGIADQRFSKIATHIRKLIVATISCMHFVILAAFPNMVVRVHDCLGAIDFDQILWFLTLNHQQTYLRNKTDVIPQS